MFCKHGSVLKTSQFLLKEIDWKTKCTFLELQKIAEDENLDLCVIKSLKGLLGFSDYITLIFASKYDQKQGVVT